MMDLNQHLLKLKKSKSKRIYKPNLNVKRRKEPEKNTPKLDSASELFPCGQFSNTLLKFPDYLPFSASQVGNCCKLSEVKEGAIGKLLVRESGKCEILIGKMRFFVDVFTPEDYREDVVCVDGKDITNLGGVCSKIVVSPNLFSIVENM